MFLVKYNKPTSDTYPCNADMTDFVNVKDVGCTSQTTFYPNQVRFLFHVKKHPMVVHISRVERKTGVSQMVVFPQT